MAAPAHRYVTLEEYERLERISETKNEWFDGEIIAMAGATFAHVRISTNLLVSVESQLRGGPCQSFVPDMRVQTKKLRAYPDLVVTCGEPRLDPNTPLATLDNPVAIFEVLSPSTASFDRGEKFEQYRTLESLRDYVVLAQDRPYVEHYSRSDDGRWILEEHKGLADKVALSGIAVKLSLTDVYERVTFPESTDE